MTGLVKTAVTGIGEVANIVGDISTKIGGLFSFTNGYDPLDMSGPQETWNYAPGPSKRFGLAMNPVLNTFYVLLRSELARLVRNFNNLQKLQQDLVDTFPASYASD